MRPLPENFGSMMSGSTYRVDLVLVQQLLAGRGRPDGKLTVTCGSFHPLVRNTLRGFAEITIAELRLTIRDVAIHQKGNARWAQLPAKPQVKDGAPVKDATGRVLYVNIMDFDSRAVRDAFSRVVVDAVLSRAPFAFDGGSDVEGTA
jgi:hypothetical protein